MVGVSRRCYSFGSNPIDDVQPATSNLHRVAIFVRIYPKLDLPYIESFLDHYRQLGFNRIVALQTGQVIPGLSKSVEKYGKRGFLEIHRPPNIETLQSNSIFNAYAHLAFNNNSDWVLVMDPDEFVMLAPRYRTIQDFITGKEAQHGRLDAIQFRWAIVEHLRVGCATEPVLNLFSSSPVWRNHLHETMVRTNSVDNNGASWSDPHHPKLKKGTKLRHSGPEALDGKEIFAFYGNLNNAPEYTYQEHALFHLHTHSLLSMMPKRRNDKIEANAHSN